MLDFQYYIHKKESSFDTEVVHALDTIAKIDAFFGRNDESLKSEIFKFEDGEGKEHVLQLFWMPDNNEDTKYFSNTMLLTAPNMQGLSEGLTLEAHKAFEQFLDRKRSKCILEGETIDPYNPLLEIKRALESVLGGMNSTNRLYELSHLASCRVGEPNITMIFLKRMLEEKAGMVINNKMINLVVLQMLNEALPDELIKREREVENILKNKMRSN